MLNDTKNKRDYDFYYALEIEFSNFNLVIQDLPNKKTYDQNQTFKEKVVEALRIQISDISNIFYRFYINKINVVGTNQKKDTTVIKLIQDKKINYNEEKDTVEKINVYSEIPFINEKIDQIVDIVSFEEREIYIDERNRNKTYFNSLLYR